MSKIEEFFEKAVAAGIIPQTPMNYDAVAYKIYIGYLENKTDELTAENAELRATLSKMEMVEKELRARLEKAVELPVKMGDWIYCITDDRIIDGEVSEIHIEEFNTTITFVQYDFDGEYIGEWYVCLENYNNWFTTRAEAEARLKELKGEI